MFNKDKKEETAEKTLTFEEIQQENETYYTRLTNKNRDYMFQLNNRLDELAYDPVKKEYVFNEMLPEVINAQRSHIPARKVYGTVREQADNIIGKNIYLPGENMGKSPTWMLYMDGALLMGGLFGIVNGIATWRAPAEQVGLLQIIMNFLIGGLAVLVLTKYAPKQGQTKGLLKYIVATAGVMFFWVVILTFILAIIPDVLNPVIPGPVIVGIAVVAIISRWYLKRKLNIKGTIF